MKDRLFDVILGGLAGFVLAAGLSIVCYDKSVRELQQYSHEVSLNAAAIALRARALADSLRHRSDSLAAARRPVILRAVLDTTAANDAHAAADRARAIGDLRAENVALRVENIALRRAVVNLWMATQTADTIIALERARGDSLQKALGDMHLQLQSLASRVEDLKPPPKWLRVSWEVVKIGGALYGGYQIGRHDRADVPPQTARVRQCHTFENGRVRCA